MAKTGLHSCKYVDSMPLKTSEETKKTHAMYLILPNHRFATKPTQGTQILCTTTAVVAVIVV